MDFTAKLKAKFAEYGCIADEAAAEKFLRRKIKFAENKNTHIRCNK